MELVIVNNVHYILLWNQMERNLHNFLFLNGLFSGIIVNSFRKNACMDA